MPVAIQTEIEIQVGDTWKACNGEEIKIIKKNEPTGENSHPTYEGRGETTKEYRQYYHDGHTTIDGFTVFDLKELKSSVDDDHMRVFFAPSFKSMIDKRSDKFYRENCWFSQEDQLNPENPEGVSPDFVVPGTGGSKGVGVGCAGTVTFRVPSAYERMSDAEFKAKVCRWMESDGVPIRTNPYPQFSKESVDKWFENLPKFTAELNEKAEKKPEYTGGSVSYYSVPITNPTTKGRQPYIAECNDIIEALNMNYAQGNAFKAIWRVCAAEYLKLMKAGYKDKLYDSEKVVFFGGRMVEQAKEK